MRHDRKSHFQLFIRPCSFASYHDPQFDSFGPLRVINEDTVEGGHGFDPHPHRDFCIFSYLLSGALRHQDSMGNTEILKRGALQYTEAGVGIRHSEYNAHASEPVRFLQIWVSPWTKGLPPRYATGQFSDGAKRNVLLQLLSPALPGGKPDEPSVPGTLAIAADFSMYASLMEDGASATHTFAEGRRGYLHVPAQPHTKAVSVNGTRLGPGDGLFIEGVSTVEISGETHGGLGSGQAAEFVLFDLR